MTHSIEIGDDTLRRLQRFAEPLLDTPDDAIRKILTLAEEYDESTRTGEVHTEATNTPPGTVSNTDSSAEGPLATAAEPAPTGPFARRRRENTAPILERNGVLTPGTELVLLVERTPAVAASLDPNDVKSQAVWEPGQSVRWKFDGHRDTLSALTRHIRDKHGIPLPSGAINGFKFWGLATDRARRSLWETGEEFRHD